MNILTYYIVIERVCVCLWMEKMARNPKIFRMIDFDGGIEIDFIIIVCVI